jgi:hypothetical protein
MMKIRHAFQSVYRFLRRISPLFMLAVALFLVANSNAMAQTVPHTFFGTSVQDINEVFPLEGGMHLGTLGKLGGTTWEYVEPSMDCGSNPNTSCHNWGDSKSGARSGILGWVTIAHLSGLQLVYDFDAMPGWMCSKHNSAGNCIALPSDLTWVSHFATALATKFKGQIKYYETGNEVDALSHWSDTCANLVLLHNTIYNAIKAADPSAVVGAPNLSIGLNSTSACATSPTPTASDASIWLSNFLRTTDPHGNLPKVDAAGVHSYPTPSTQYPLYGCDRHTNKLHCAAQPLLTLYNNFRSVMNKHGLSSAPLLITEGGFGQDASADSCNPLYEATACLDPTQQIAYIGRWLVLSASSWSDGSGQLPSWNGYNFNWGTLNGTSGMNPNNASAYGQMESWISGAVFSQQCHTGTPSTVYVCNFTTSGQQYEIVFNDNNSVTATYTTPSWATSFQPLLGTDQLIHGGTIVVGDTPILLRPVE